MRHCFLLSPLDFQKLPGFIVRYKWNFVNGVTTLYAAPFIVTGIVTSFIADPTHNSDAFSVL
jgi:hypothetical protein